VQRFIWHNVKLELELYLLDIELSCWYFWSEKSKCFCWVEYQGQTFFFLLQDHIIVYFGHEIFFMQNFTKSAAIFPQTSRIQKNHLFFSSARSFEFHLLWSFPIIFLSCISQHRNRVDQILKYLKIWSDSFFSAVLF